MKALLPSRRFEKWNNYLLVKVAERWIATNNFFIGKILQVNISSKLPQTLNRKDSYLVVSNHRSWVDILVLQYSMNRKLPFFRFFIKDSLKWVPFLGIAWKLLDFPFMKRYSRSELEKHPELKTKDLETAKMACKLLVGKPASLLIFLEGTRFSVEKHDSTHSAFEHLLAPKIGGATSVLDMLGSQIKTLVDVTIFYPEGAKGFWQLLTGEIRNIILEAREIEIPQKFRMGVLQSDPALRADFDSWLQGIWKEKDLRIQQLSH